MENADLASNSTKIVSFIIYTGSSNCPSVNIFKESNFQPVYPEQFSVGFWVFTLNDINETKYIDLHFSLRKSQTLYYCFETSSLPPFIFLDLEQTRNLVSFSKFYSFFSNLVTYQKINFNFNKDQLHDLTTFIQSFTLFPHKFKFKHAYDFSLNGLSVINYYTNNQFDKTPDYLIYALIYISCQPWYWIFTYNESLSNILINIITLFILEYFYNSKTMTRSPDFKNSIPYAFEPTQIQPEKIIASKKFNSTHDFINNFLSLLSIQLGEGFAFVISSILFFNTEDTYVSSLTYNSNKNSLE